jgi:hypothetical protein
LQLSTDPDNASIKDDILRAIANKKLEITGLEEELRELRDNKDYDKDDFLRFAFGFVDNIASNYFSASKESRKKCKQLLFPAGFYMNSDKKVYTPEISILYRLAGNKKDLSISDKSLLVRVKRL